MLLQDLQFPAGTVSSRRCCVRPFYSHAAKAHVASFKHLKQPSGYFSCASPFAPSLVRCVQVLPPSSEMPFSSRGHLASWVGDVLQQQMWDKLLL